MEDLKKENTYFRKRKGVMIRMLYFTIGFMISIGMMIPCYPRVRVSGVARLYDLREDSIANSVGKPVSLSKLPIYTSI